MQNLRLGTAPAFLAACILLFYYFNHSQGPLSAPIQLKSEEVRSEWPRNWNYLPNKKVLVVQFISAERVEEFLDSWPNHEDSLLLKTHNSSLILTFPAIDYEYIDWAVVQNLRWTLIEQYDHEHAFANGPLLHYKTLSGVDILVQPMNLHLPRPYLQHPTVPTCQWDPEINQFKTWSLSYVLYSGAVFSYHIIQLPVLSKFDYFLKVDTDINFIKDMPFDIGEKMDKEGCLIAHSEVHDSNDCENDALDALWQATKALDLHPPKSKNYGWCNEKDQNRKPANIFYGNFLAFSTHKLLIHPDIQGISRFLYEDYEYGYYASRWGDQAPFAMYACYMLDIPDIYNDPKLCDFRPLRDDVFVHF